MPDHHLSIQVADFAKAARSHDTVLATIGGKRIMDFPGAARAEPTDRTQAGGEGDR